MFSLDSLRDAIVFGLLGCFYAAVSVGLSALSACSTCLYIAHPAFLVLGSYGNFQRGPTRTAGTLSSPEQALMPVFFLLGMGVYRFYYESFEKRGTDAGLRGLAFSSASCSSSRSAWCCGSVWTSVWSRPNTSARASRWDMRLPKRLLVAFGVALVLTIAPLLHLSKTFTGRATGGGRAGRAGAAADGCEPGPHQAMGVRHRDWQALGARRRAAHHRRAG